MNNEDMSDMMKNLSSLLEGKQLPDNMQEILNNFKNSNGNNSDGNSDNKSDSKSNSKSNLNNSSNNIDPEMINNLVNMLANNSNDNSNKENNSNSSSSSNIDIETIMKMKKIIDEVNNTENDPRANLLLSLKPYLKDSRKDKVEQYIKLLNMGKVARVLNINGGDKNK